MRGWRWGSEGVEVESNEPQWERKGEKDNATRKVCGELYLIVYRATDCDVCTWL